MTVCVSVSVILGAHKMPSHPSQVDTDLQIDGKQKLFFKNLKRVFLVLASTEFAHTNSLVKGNSPLKPTHRKENK